MHGEVVVTVRGGGAKIMLSKTFVSIYSSVQSRCLLSFLAGTKRLTSCRNYITVGSISIYLLHTFSHEGTHDIRKVESGEYLH